MTNNSIILRDSWFVEDSEAVKIWKDETLSKLVDIPVYIYRPKIQPCPIRGAFAVPGFDVIMIPADWRLSELWDIMGLGMLYHEVGHLRDPEAANLPYYQKGSTIVGYAASDVARLNPCFSGCWSRTYMHRISGNKRSVVLILVLVDVGLGHRDCRVRHSRT